MERFFGGGEGARQRAFSDSVAIKQENGGEEETGSAPSSPERKGRPRKPTLSVSSLASVMHRERKEEKEEPSQLPSEEDLADRQREALATAFVSFMARQKCAMSRVKLDRSNKRKSGSFLSSDKKVFFGLDLETVLRLEQAKRNRKTPHHVPIFLTKCLAFVESEGMEEEGIFRKGGSIQRVKLLRQVCDQREGDINLYDPEYGVQANDVTALIKQFLRELPEPLLTARLTAWFSAVARLSSDEHKVTALQLLLCMLPVAHVETTRALLDVLYKVQLKKDINKMDAHALATLVGPNLVPNLANEKLLEDDRRDDIISVTEALILHTGELFRTPQEVLERVEAMEKAARPKSAKELEEEEERRKEEERKEHPEEPHSPPVKETVKILKDTVGDRAVIRVEIRGSDGKACHKSHIAMENTLALDIVQKSTKQFEGDGRKYGLFTIAADGILESRLADTTSILPLVKADPNMKLCVAELP
eukprot:comp16391_c0_seq1/m.14267 comp16391_c0_seq1/g.14267  ORF comp16391_c0_seq1/g.14267 comp16391_c0_seq1/m.14267 type:complete len:477 (-) comp16391_c0_seq1:700-2130(-)